MNGYTQLQFGGAKVTGNVRLIKEQKDSKNFNFYLGISLKVQPAINDVLPGETYFKMPIEECTYSTLTRELEGKEGLASLVLKGDLNLFLKEHSKTD